MTGRTIRIFWPCLVGLVMAVAACEGPTDGAQVALEHPIDPNGNHLIASQRTYGAPSSFGRIISDGGDGYYFAGDGASVGHMDAGFDIDWTDNTIARVVDVVHISARGPWANTVLAVGSFIGSDGRVEAGAVGLYDASGYLVDTLRVYSDTLAVDLNAVVTAVADDPMAFVVVGSVAEGGRKPFAARIQLSSADSTLQVVGDSTYSDMLSMEFIDVAAPAAPTSSYYIARNFFSAPTRSAVVSIDAAFNVDWETDVEPAVHDSTAINTRLRVIEYSGETLYVTGEAQVDKGGYFARAGVVGAVTATGDTLWVRTDNASPWQDSYDGLAVANGNVVTVGRSAQTFLPDFGDNLGYALLSARVAATGDSVSGYRIGRNDRWNGFRALIVGGSIANCVGFQRDPQAGVSIGWVAEVNTP